jgi:hypothetical protein
MSFSLSVSVASPIANYAELQDEILNWMDREGDAAAIARVPKWIQLAESWFNRELRTPDMEQSVTFSVEDEDRPLPADFLALRSIYQETSPDNPLIGMSPDQLRNDYRGQGGIPQAYSIVAGGIRVAPVPTEEVLFTMDYFARIESLSVVAPSNWLLEQAPDLYLFAALFYGYTWARSPEQAMEAQGLAVAILDRLKTTSTASRWGAGQKPLPARQVGKGRC